MRLAGLALLAAIVAVPAFGYYRAYVQPTNDWAGRIGGETVVTVGDVADRMQTMARLNSTTGSAPLGNSPFEVLRGMMEEELIRLGALRFGLEVTDEDVQRALRDRFVSSEQGGTATAEQLDGEFREAYGRFLTRGRLADEAYRELVRIQVIREVLRQELGTRIPRVAEQVELAWIVLPADFERAETVLGLLDAGEPFESVASSLNTDAFYADPSRPGYVGWVPRGAFPQLDAYIFNENVAPGTLADPVFTRTGIYIIRIVTGPAVREIESEKMMDKLKEEAMARWVAEEWSRQDVTLDFTSDDYAWVIENVRESLPASP